MFKLKNIDVQLSKRTFQIICSIIGILGITFIMASNTQPPVSTIAILFCVLLIIFAFISTGKFGRFFTGGEEPQQEGGFGRS